MRKNRRIGIALLIGLVLIVATVVIWQYYSLVSTPQSLPQYSIYAFTKNGNHTQLQISYSNGVTTQVTQLESLSFDNKTALGSYVQIRDEDCVSTNTENSFLEYRVRVDCNTTGFYTLTRSGNHTRYKTTYSNGATSGPIDVLWLGFDNKTELALFVHHSRNCISAVVLNTSIEYRIRIQC